MATGSTASSDTEGRDTPAADRADVTPLAADLRAEPRPVAGADSGAAAGAPTASSAAPIVDHDASRRAFFRQFGKQAVTAAGQVAGMANILNRTTSAAAANLLGLGEPVSTRPQRAGPWTGASGRAAGTPVTVRPAADDTYRSPYRLVGDELMLLDQRGIPGAIDEIVARRGSDVAYYLRLGACRGGPLMAQVAAYGLALTAGERATYPPRALEAELRRTSRALTAARPSSRLVGWAMERMQPLSSSLPDDATGASVAVALRTEADGIADHFQAGHAAIVDALVELLSDPPDRPLALLLHGDPGILSGGLVGTAITALGRLHSEGRRLRVFVTETRPFMDGARLGGWELRQAGIDHKVIPDAAVAWLFEREAIDAVLIGAEWIAANGDTGAVVGSRAIAQQAAAVAERPPKVRPRVIVCGVIATIDPATPDGDAIPEELRPARDLLAYLGDVPIPASDALVPASDVIPAGAISALVTERGALSPPSHEAIAALLGPVAVEPL